MIAAMIEEVVDEAGNTQSWGSHNFLQLPAPGDRVLAYKGSGQEEMIVLYVLHRPMPALVGSQPGATVYGRFT